MVIFLISILIISLIIYLSILYKNIQIRKFNIQMIDKYTTYISILELYMKKAYDMIYRDRIIVYSVEGMKLNDKEFEIVVRDFAKLVLKFLGKNIQLQLELFYGDSDSLLLNITEYFHSRYEDDEIRKAALANISEGNDTLGE